MGLNAYRIKGFRGGISDDAYKGVAGAFRFGLWSGYSGRSGYHEVQSGTQKRFRETSLWI
jgi:hypothetical protein